MYFKLYFNNAETMVNKIILKFDEVGHQLIKLFYKQTSTSLKFPSIVSLTPRTNIYSITIEFRISFEQSFSNISYR